MMKFKVLWSDDDVLVIEKPPGVVVNQSETHDQPTVQAWMAEQLTSLPSGEWQSLIPPDFNPEFGSPEEIMAERQGIVHRLDKDTSGVMVLAKNPGALVALLRQFKQRQTTKEYLALVHGKFQVPEATVSLPLGRASRDRKLFAVRADGREAVTRYQVSQEFKAVNLELLKPLHPELTTATWRRFDIYQGFSLIHCWPKTGRTHQIRVHLAHLQHPLVGDTTYVGRKRQHLDPLWCPRHFLHAFSLDFIHPRTHQPLHVECPLSSDLQAVLNLLH